MRGCYKQLLVWKVCRDWTDFTHSLWWLPQPHTALGCVCVFVSLLHTHTHTPTAVTEGNNEGRWISPLNIRCGLRWEVTLSLRCNWWSHCGLSENLSLLDSSFNLLVSTYWIWLHDINLLYFKLRTIFSPSFAVDCYTLSLSDQRAIHEY